MTPRTTARIGLIVVVLLVAVALLVPGRFGSDATPDEGAAGRPTTTTTAPGTATGPVPTTALPPAAAPEATAAPGAVPVADGSRPAGGGGAPVDPAVEQAVAGEGRTPVIVQLDVPDAGSPQEQADAVAAAADQVLAALPAGSYSAVKPTGSVPALAVSVDAAGLDALRTAGPVARVGQDGINYPTSLGSTVSIGADLAWASGTDGTGSVVAVLDTGVASAHPYLMDGLNPKVIGQACFSTSSPSSVPRILSNCPNSQSMQVGPGAAAPCTTSSACRHGTHVAGIAAGGSGAASLASGTFQASGVAPGANLLAVQVFSTYQPTSACLLASSCSIVAYDSDIISALDWLYANRATYPGLAAVNLSLGGGRYAPGTCDATNAPMKTAIDRLRSVGIATVIASGNNSSRGSISSPGCISSAIAVGSVDDATMTVSDFGNLSSDVDLLAPGANIWSSVPPTGMGYLSGTSMATPAVSGAFAALHQLRPDLGVSQLLATLQTTGTPVATGLSSGPATLPYLSLSLAAMALGPPTPGDFNAMAPVRVLDTRATAPIGAGKTRTVDVTAKSSGVPAGATAVVANITVTNPTTDGYLTAYPGGSPPTASNLNFVAGQTVPNLVTVQLDGRGRFQLYNSSGQSDAIVDVVGWYQPGSGVDLHPIAPSRVLDTRSEGGPVTAGGTRKVDATRAGAPAGATAVVANVTVTDPTVASFLTAYPGGTPPTASNLNFVPGQTVPNLVTVKLAPDGSFTVYNLTGSANVIVDVVGWFSSDAGGSQFVAMAPTRVTDTRSGSPVAPGGGITVNTTGVGVPANATAVIANITATDPTVASFLTAYPSGTPPNASNLNFVAGQTVPNLVTVKLDGTGRFRVFNQQGTVDVVVDVVGWYQ